MGSRGAIGRFVLALATLAVIAVGCGDGTTTQVCPTMLPTIRQTGTVNKLDLLFAIDNSASMAEKQELLRNALPALFARFLNPDCVNTVNPQLRQKSNVGLCPTGYAIEFEPIVDIHVGVVTSSLGGGGSPDVCDGTSQVPAGVVRHDNDGGRLINRTAPGGGAEGTVAKAKATDGNGGNFLAWLPNVPPNQGKPAPNVPAETDATAFVADFQSLVVGAQEYGCGLEAPLESWYRFLVQPDPWADIPKASGGSSPVTLDGVDGVLLKQRKDFLREDSLVAVIMLTDEEDSWSDPLAIGGRGWVTRTQNFPSAQARAAGTMPRGTSECNSAVDPNNPTTTGPNHKDCTSCGFTGNKPGGSPIASDTECLKACGANCVGFYTPAEDGLNVRYTNDMKRRYGFDPQFPIQRYVDGLKSLKVPNREGEHKGGAGSYLGTKNCTNPLFARDLPNGSDQTPDALCNLKVGPRTPDLVFFAVIGGVPWQLLSQDPNDEKSAFKASLDEFDWVKILGKDPATYQTDGIDPHMLESIAPRPGLPATTASNTADPVHGREWKTSYGVAGIDLQYACTFPLTVPKDCTLPANKPTCECVGPAAGAEGSPLCNGQTQVRGKAYPTIRQLRVAKALGPQGLVASICARNTVDASAANYAYRSIVDGIASRLHPVVSSSCYPSTHARDAAGKIACRVLVQYEPGTTTTCDSARGLTVPSVPITECYRTARLAELKASDPSATLADIGTVCELAQLGAPSYQVGTCTKSATPGWCYVLGSESGGACPQEIAFTATGKPSVGTRVTVQCNP